MADELIIIGGGVNGLVTAAYLAKAGVPVLVLEARRQPGGLALSEEASPGFRFDSVGHDAGWLLPRIASDLGLAAAGLELVVPDVSTFSPLPGGPSLTLWTDPAKTVEEITRFSPEDARRWSAFTEQLARFAKVLDSVYAMTPPHIPDAAAADLLSFIGLGRRLRGLGRRGMMEFLRVAPMSVAEWLDDWFVTDALKGVIGASGITRIFQGPRSAGTAFLALHHHVGRPPGAVRAVHVVRGGLGQLGRVLAKVASGFGAKIRTMSAVREIVVREGRVIGVALESGEHLAARQVVSSADPRRTFCDLMDAGNLDPEFLRAVRNIKYRGAVATVSLALGELPRFRPHPGNGASLRGAICIAPSLDYLEHAYDDAKYGGVSKLPYLEARIPTLLDPSLAPAGKHIMTVQVQYAPYHLKTGSWDAAARERLADLVVTTLTEFAPNLKSSVLARHVVTPKDLEDQHGLTEGHAYHGELTLDQIFFMRPVAGWSRYRTPIHGLFLCGAGTHPGGGLAGAPGRNAARELLKREPRR